MSTKTTEQRVAELVAAAPQLTAEQLEEVVRVLAPAVKARRRSKA